MLLDIILISKLYVQQDDADENNIPGNLHHPLGLPSNCCQGYY